jgi:LysR family cyn operon transcriptional activator
MSQPLHADRLRVFLALAQEGGFSRAARKLGQSQSSVSQAVGALEEQLAERLVVRSGRKSELTEIGRVVARHAERISNELEQLRESLAARRELRVGRLALGTSDTLATYVLPSVFARFRQRYPDIELSLDNRPSPVIAERVAQRALDLGVVSLPLPGDLRISGRAASELLHVEPLVRQRDVLIVSPAHAWARKRAVQVRELATQPLLLLDRSTSTRALLDARFRELSLEPRVAMEMSSVEVLKRLVELDFGASVVPEVSALREVSQGTLKAIALRGFSDERSVGVLTPRGGGLSHAARAFATVLRETLRSR